MAHSTKGLRKIVVDDRSYRWWVHHDDDQDFPGDAVLVVVSVSGHLRLAYGLHQPEARRIVVARGLYFRGIAGISRHWHRFRCQAFGNGVSVGPGDVAALIRWAHDTEGRSEEIDWRGNVTWVPNGAVALPPEPPPPPERLVRRRVPRIKPAATRRRAPGAKAARARTA